jgi:uncharacterized membrane protein
MKTLRGERHVSRLEALSDAVFAFSATLLVVSLEVPATFGELVEKLHGFLAFALSFAALLMIWSVHNAYFRRYALQDRWTVVLNSVLLFVVLFYVYPLKFVTLGISTSLFGVGASSASRMISTVDELAQVFMLYGLGFIAIFACFGLMYRHAHRRRETLELSPQECEEARFLCRHYLLFACVGVASVAVAWLRVGIQVALPGWLYGLLGPVLFGHSWWSERRRAQSGVESRAGD